MELQVRFRTTYWMKWLLPENQCGKVIADQCADEQEIACAYFFPAGKNADHKFYNVNEAMYLVDLPGYGYANANIEIKAKWGQMIENYLHTSKRLKAVFLLIDIRHEPSENDQMMYEWMVHQDLRQSSLQQNRTN